MTCPLCEATCGLAVTLDGDPGHRGARRRRGRVLPRVHLPEGRLAGRAAPRPRPAAGAAAQAGRRVRRGELGRGVRGDRPAAAAAARRARPGRGRDLRGQPVGAQHVDRAVRAAFFKAVGTRNFYTASTVDQLPKHYSAGHMFGHPLTIPVPDLDRTGHLLLLGANPLVSNGSLMTAPDVRGRLRGIRDRGGKIVVVDPKRSRTAEVADEHHAIRPGTDALLLFALVNVLFAEDLVALGALADARGRGGRGARAGRAVHPGGRRARHRHRRGGDRADGARARRRAAGRGLRPDRHDDPGVRHARELARRRAERADRQPRPAGRRDVPAGRGRAGERRAGQAARRGRSAAGTAGCASCPR